jgi:hypothetical protein
VPPDPPPTSTDPPPDPPPLPIKRNPPGAVDLEAALRAVRARFRSEFAQQAPDLAPKLITASRDEGIEPAFQFALLQEARDAAAREGDATSILLAVARLEEHFIVDRVRLTLEALGRCPIPRTPGSMTALCAKFAAAIDDAIGADRFEEISKFSAKAEALARAAKDAEVPQALRRAQALQKEYASVAGAHATLRRSPEDPAANLAFGRYVCLAKGDWTRGLPLLALASDPVIRAIAVRELRPDKDSDARLAILEGWLSLYRADDTPLRRANLLDRSGACFDEIAPELDAKQRDALLKRLNSSIRSDATQSDGRLDLERLLRVGRHSVNGAWRLDAGTILSPRAGDDTRAPARLWIPFAPPDEFDLEVVIERVEAGDAFLVGVAGGDRPFAVQLDGASGSGYWARGQWRGLGARGLFAPGRRQPVVIAIREEGGAAMVDGKAVVSWTAADRASLATGLGVPQPRGIVLGAQGPFRVHSIRLREFRAKGEPLR